MKLKAKKVLSVATSAALIAVMGIAGTFAYFQDTSDAVINTFKRNKVSVTLTETGKDGETQVTSRDDYNIIPGTSQKKDPKVTVANTVDSYVFVKVEDASDGIIEYEIADGWKSLSGYSGVYYREVKKDDEAKEFQVLKDDKVSYPSSLTNKDMEDEEGDLKDDVTLTFTAYAIQQVSGTEADGTDTVFAPEDAWLQIPVIVKAGEKDFVKMVEESDANEVVMMTENISIDRTIPQSKSGITNIDLGGNTLTLNTENRTEVTKGNALTLENGKIEYEGNEGANTSISVQEGAAVTLKEVNMTTSGAALYPSGGAAEVNVIDSTIIAGSYCVATNASTPENYNVRINLQNSELKGSTPVLINIPGKLSMNNCKVTADMQGVVVRGGTAVIENCTIENTSENGWALNYFDNRNWESGNTLPLAGITIGNKSDSYQYPSNVTLIGTKVTSKIYPTIYIYGNVTEENGASLTYDNESDVGNVICGGGYVVINGEVQNQ